MADASTYLGKAKEFIKANAKALLVGFAIGVVLGLLFC